MKRQCKTICSNLNGQDHTCPCHRLYLYHHLWFHTGTPLGTVVYKHIDSYDWKLHSGLVLLPQGTLSLLKIVIIITIQIIFVFTQNVLKLLLSIYACIIIISNNISLKKDSMEFPCFSLLQYFSLMNPSTKALTLTFHKITFDCIFSS